MNYILNIDVGDGISLLLCYIRVLSGGYSITICNTCEYPPFLNDGPTVSCKLFTLIFLAQKAQKERILHHNITCAIPIYCLTDVMYLYSLNS